jgi:hypothetical protein
MELENEMELEIGNEYLYYEKPEKYINRVDQFNKRMEFLLDEFIKNYVIARMNPNNEDLQRIYENVNSNIRKLNGKLFTMSNSIQNNINNINKKLTELDVLIRRQKSKNKNIRKQLGMVESQNISASEMNIDYGEIYDRNYLRNWGLFISTIICIFSIKSIYDNRIV